jgi:AraC family transcriptional regulator, transcriptional activator FtrA
VLRCSGEIRSERVDAPPRRHRVVVVVPADFSLFELGIAVEAFALPRDEFGVGWYDVAVCSASPGCVRTMGGLFCASILNGVETIDEADTVIVPQADETDFPATPEVLAAVRRAHARGARLVSTWTGVFVLAAAGVLDGRRAAVHWKHAGRFAASFPRVNVDSHVLYLNEGNLVTSAGTASGIDLSLHILRKDHGARVARHIARLMVAAPHRDGDQAQYLRTPMQEWAPRPDGIAVAMEHALRHLDTELTLDELAAAACMSTRHFSRRFREVTGTSPARWVTNQKLARAQALLEETDHSIEYVATAAGFGSPVTFRQRFSQGLDMSPAAYRRQFRTHRTG